MVPFGLVLIGAGAVMLLLIDPEERRMRTQMPPRALGAVPLLVGIVLLVFGLWG